jgi:MFS family permease
LISNWLSSALARRNIHYGWVMVGVTFLTALITAGAVGAPGVFIVPLQREFGWSTAEISSALSIRFILFGLMAPFAAALMNRYGLRNVALSALLIVASALVASLAMTKVWHLLLLWGVVIGIGTGMTALVLGATIAARWFNARRGLVVGILTASVATGQLVFLPMLASVTERFGWRIALSIVCAMLGVAAFAVLMLMRDRPSDVGLRPFGDQGTEPLPAPPPSNAPIMAAALGQDADFLDPVCDVLHLRRFYQRSGPGSSDPDVPRFRHSAGAGREPARRHGRVRLLRHHLFGLAVGPLR